MNNKRPLTPRRRRVLALVQSLTALLSMLTVGVPVSAQQTAAPDGGLSYYYITMTPGSGATRYDDYLAAVCLQGLLNRDSDMRFYMRPDSLTQKWLAIMQEEGRWLEGKTFEKVNGFAGMMDLGRDYVKAVIIWDEAVPATVNAATTAAGVEDGIPMTWTAYQRYKDCFNENVKIIDLRGKFDGSVTGSAKNDAYRWAIEEYLNKGLCSRDLVCSFFDSWNQRAGGDTSYLAQRDWAVYNRAFVVDLSVWPDEAPFDDPDQPIGTDHATYTMVMEKMRELTADGAPFELMGFFVFEKYAHNGRNTASQHGDVETEWQIVHFVTPYHGYQNTCVEWTWNQSLHCQYQVEQLTNNRPAETVELNPYGNYLCIFMADFDSTYPLYNYMFDYWKDPHRGEVPLNWGINPNLMDTYGDVISYYYETATPNDFFVADASAAGYFNFNRVPEDQWPSVLQHNLDYFKRADMSIAPMILDRARLSDLALQNVSQFAKDGMGTIIMYTAPGDEGQAPNFMYGDTPATMLYNNFDRGNVQNAARNFHDALVNSRGRTTTAAALAMVRCVWVSPTYIHQVLEAYNELFPTEHIEVVDIYTYFDLLRQDMAKGLIGDVNNDGNVNASDALLALQSSVKLTELDRLQQITADVDDNGSINASDALQILQCSVNLISRDDFWASW